MSRTNDRNRRRQLFRFFYRNLVKPIFFQFDPEFTHDTISKFGKVLGQSSLSRDLTRNIFSYKDPTLEQRLFGLNFPNPIGLAAGFDKNAQLVEILPEVGFGFMEVGSVTAQPFIGNPRPRLHRLKKAKALIVNYGLKNDGMKTVSARLKDKKTSIPLGVSVAMTNCPETADLKVGITDFSQAFRTFTEIGDYITVNASCPNTELGMPFLEPKNLDTLLTRLDKIKRSVPVFIKLSPDLDDDRLYELLEIIDAHNVQGLIISNLTKNRQRLRGAWRRLPESGGSSGKLVEELSNKMIEKVFRRSESRYVIIGCGGVFSAQDAYKKIRLGASLIQLITGMIFEGPQLIGEINCGLSQLLKRDGYTNISQAIGADIDSRQP